MLNRALFTTFQKIACLSTIKKLHWSIKLVYTCEHIIMDLQNTMGGAVSGLRTSDIAILLKLSGQRSDKVGWEIKNPT